MSEEKNPDMMNEKKEDADNSVAVPMDDLDESKAQLIKSNANGGAGDVTVGIIDPTSGSSDGDVSFNGLGKDEVLQYANDPFWVRLRWILFILFWVGWTAMLVTAVVIIVLAPKCPHRPDMKWYEKGAIYQVYTKSFKDTAKDGSSSNDMDGIGDFKGLKEEMEYITDTLGIEAVYLNSIYKTEELANSPYLNDMAIIDHKMLDESFGTTLAAFKSWVRDLRKKGKQVIVDLIPNQTSKKHEWYEKAINGDAKYKDYYIWTKDNVAGKSWTEEAKLGEYYYHSLSADLPDLNLNNEAVREEITSIMKFWFDIGVGGFRINGIDYLVEDENVGQSSGNQTSAGGGTLKYLEELRSVADSYSDKPGRERFLFATVDTTDTNSTADFYMSDSEKEEKRLHMVLYNIGLDGACNADCLLKLLEPISDDVLPWVGLELSNENLPRIGSKLAANSDFENGIKIAHALQMLLPGTPFNYYGDEFGLKGGKEADLASGYNPMNSRTPMQWNGHTNAGFTSPSVTPWVPMGQGYEEDNLAASEAHFKDYTVLSSFQDLIKLHEKESFQWGKLEACAHKNDVMMFTRKAKGFPSFLTLINTGSSPQNVLLSSIDCVKTKEEGTVRYHSRNEQIDETLDLTRSSYLEPGDIVVFEFTK